MYIHLFELMKQKYQEWTQLVWARRDGKTRERVANDCVLIRV